MKNKDKAVVVSPVYSGSLKAGFLYLRSHAGQEFQPGKYFFRRFRAETLAAEAKLTTARLNSLREKRDRFWTFAKMHIAQLKSVCFFTSGGSEHKLQFASQKYVQYVGALKYYIPEYEMRVWLPNKRSYAWCFVTLSSSTWGRRQASDMIKDGGI